MCEADDVGTICGQVNVFQFKFPVIYELKLTLADFTETKDVRIFRFEVDKGNFGEDREFIRVVVLIVAVINGSCEFLPTKFEDVHRGDFVYCPANPVDDQVSLLQWGDRQLDKLLLVLFHPNVDGLTEI